MALERGDKLGKSDEAGAVLAEAAEQAAGRGRHAELCVEAVRFGVEKGGKAGLNKVREGVGMGLVDWPFACVPQEVGFHTCCRHLAAGRTQVDPSRVSPN